MSDVYVIGIDMIKFGRFPEISVPRLGANAAHLATPLGAGQRSVLEQSAGAADAGAMLAQQRQIVLRVDALFRAVRHVRAHALDEIRQAWLILHVELLIEVTHS